VVSLDEIKVMPEEIAACLSADMRGGRPVDSFLTACRLYLKQRRREQIESVREFYQRLPEGRARLTPCESKLTLLNADEDVWRSTEEGEHFLLGEGGEIKAGFGGKFTGKKPSEVWGEGKQAAASAKTAAQPANQTKGGKSGSKQASGSGAAAANPPDATESAFGITKGNPIDIQQAADGANTNYAPKSPYSINCQRCVPTYELRRRGYDVEAKPRPAAGQTNTIAFGSECFVDSAGNQLEYSKPTTKKAVRDELKNAPDGARYGILTVWKGQRGKARNAHVFVAEKENGKVRFIDPQNTKADAAGYLNRGQEGRFRLLRMDNATINPNANILNDIAEVKKP